MRNQNRPTQRSAELIPLQHSPGRGEKIARIELAVPQEFKRVAIQAVRAGFRGYIERASGARILRRIRVLHHAEFLQRIHRCLDPCPALMLFRDVHAIEQERSLRARHAADHVPVHLFGTHSLHIARGRQQGHARRHAPQFSKFPSVQRQVSNLFRRNHLAQRCRLCGEQRDFGRHFNLSCRLANPQFEIHPRCLGHRQFDAAADGCLEPR